MINKFALKIASFFLLLTIVTSCASTGSPWGRSSTPAQTGPSKLAEVQLSVDDEGTVYDPYDYYVRKNLDGEIQQQVQPIQDGADMSQLGDYSQATGTTTNPATNPSLVADNTQPSSNDYLGTEGQSVVDQYGQLQDPQQAQEPIMAQPARKVKVALLLPLSGPNKIIGQEMLNAAQMALFEVGDVGFELLPKDTKGTVDGAVLAASEAAQAGAQLVLGPLFADNVRAIRPILSSYGIQAISFSTDWSVANNNTFVMGILPHAQVARITDYIVDQGYENFAFVAPSSSYGELVHTVYSRVLRSRGKKLYPENTLFYSPLESDFSHRVREFVNYDERHTAYEEEYEEISKRAEQYPHDRQTRERKYELDQINTIGDLPFEVLMVPVGGEDAKTIVNLLRYYDIDQHNSVLIGTGLWDDAGLISEPAFNGTLFASPSPQARGMFEKNYNALYGKKPVRIASLAYDATALASVISAQAYRAGYPNEMVFSRSALLNPNGFAGVDGIFRFNSNGIVDRGLAVLEIQKGNLIVRAPAPITFER